MLSTSGGCATAVGGRGSAGGCGELQARSKAVPGVARKLRSCSEAGLVHRSWGSVFWVQFMNFKLFRWSVALRELVGVPLDWWRFCEGGEVVGLEWRHV